MRPQSKGEVHRAREDDRETAPQRADGGLRVVQTAPPRAGERAAENPQRQAPRPLPVLRSPDELLQSSLWQFYRRVRRIWREWLSRRTRGRPLTWERYAEILRQYPLLRPRITHAWAGAGSHA